MKITVNCSSGQLCAGLTEEDAADSEIFVLITVQWVFRAYLMKTACVIPLSHCHSIHCYYRNVNYSCFKLLTFTVWLGILSVIIIVRYSIYAILVTVQRKKGVLQIWVINFIFTKSYATFFS